jgi:DNA replication protein DnaC
VLTSNKAFSDWSQVFANDPIMASATLDRLLHRSTVINIRGDSYRLKSERQAHPASTKEVPQDNPASI